MSAQSASTNIGIIHSSWYHINHDESLIFEDNDISENFNVFSDSSLANSIKSHCYNFGLIKKEFSKIFLQKIITPLHRLTHLFIFFHCWKFLFS